MMHSSSGTGSYSLVMSALARVLVVDDYADTAESMSRLVRMLGKYDVRQALSGRDALEEIERFDPQLVLLDIGLPDVTGYEIARAIRARANRRQPYLVAISGWGGNDRRQQAMAAGFDRHVLKPPPVTVVRQVLECADEKAAITAPL
jgi:CheY-like chemotaxis protein